MIWDEVLDALGEGYIVKLPDKPTGIRVEMGTYIECWENGNEIPIGEIDSEFKKSDEWEIAEWNLNA